MNNAEELRQKSLAELTEALTTSLREQFDLRMQNASGQPPRPHQFKQLRRAIARINTVIAEKEGSSK